MAIVVFITFLKVLALNDRLKPERVRLKEEQGCWLSHRVYLKYGACISNVAAVAICKNMIVKWTTRASESKYNAWPWIDVQRSRKKIGKLRRNTSCLTGNNNDRLIFYLKEKDCQATNRTQKIESIGSKSKTKKSKIVNDASYIGICYQGV